VGLIGTRLRESYDGILENNPFGMRRDSPVHDHRMNAMNVSTTPSTGSRQGSRANGNSAAGLIFQKQNLDVLSTNPAKALGSSMKRARESG